MRLQWRVRSIFASVLLLTLAACGDVQRPSGIEPTTQPTEPRPVAEVVVKGGDVYVNEVRVSGTLPLFENDKIRTGSSGFADINFDNRSTLTMAPNSDPKLLFVSQAGCVAGELVVRLWNGTFTYEGVANVCFDNPTHQTTVDPASAFRVVISDDSFAMNVTNGEVLVSTGPTRETRFTLRRNFGIVVSKGQTLGPQRTIQ